MVRGMGKEMWKCLGCETKDKDIKSVLESIQNLHSEMKEIKQGQEDQQVERERVIEGLKVVESVAIRVDKIETVQASQEARISVNEVGVQENAKQIEENRSKMADLEERLNKIDSDALNVRQTNAVVREIREIEKRERNIIICNVPETEDENADVRKTQDEIKVGEILKELKREEITPINVIRVGTKGRYPRKILAILQSVDECERVLKGGEETQLKGGVFITRDRTYNQRVEARQYRQEREREEREGVIMPRGRGRGNGRGAGRSRGRGSVRGRGSRGPASISRKRRSSMEADDSKRPRLQYQMGDSNPENTSDTQGRSQHCHSVTETTPQQRPQPQAVGGETTPQ